MEKIIAKSNESVNDDGIKSDFLSDRSIAENSKQESYEFGDIVFNNGSAANKFFLIKQGWVKLTRQTPDGKETVVGLCTEGDFLGEEAIFDWEDYKYNAEVISDKTIIISIPAKKLKETLEKNSNLSTKITRLIGEQNFRTRLKIEQMSTMSAMQRLGCFFLDLKEKQEQKPKEKQKITIPVEKNVLASYLGMKPETLSRSQNQLETHGVNISGNEIEIKDLSKLKQFVCSSCSNMGSCREEN